MRVRKVPPPGIGSDAFARPMRLDRPAARTIAGITPASYNRSHERGRPPHPMSALRSSDGNARPGPGYALDSRPVLGLPGVRAAFLVDLSTPEPRETESDGGACL